MRRAARPSNAPVRIAYGFRAVAFGADPDRVAGWASRVLLAAGVVVAIARTTPNAGPLALAGRLARETLERGVPLGATSLGWLGAWATALLSSLGSAAVAAASAACALGAFALVEFRARPTVPADPPARGAAPPAAQGTRRLSFLAPPLAALCALDAFAPGGGMGAWLAWAFVLVLLDRPSPLKLVVLAAATAVWCNLEPEGVLAPLAAIAVAAGATLDRADPGSLGRNWLAALIAVAATCCTPAGFGFAPAALIALHLGHAARGIVASSPAAVAPHAYPAGLAVALAFALAGGLRARGLREALPVLLAFLLALADGAFLPFFGIAAAPAIVAGLRKIGRERSMPALLAPVLAAVVATAIVFAANATLRADGAILLARREAAAHGAHGVLFCTKVVWCDVARAAGERVVVDGRLASAGATALDEQRTIVALGSGWRGSLRRSGATAVLAAKDSALATLLGLSSTWRLAARDGQHVLYERAAP